MSILRMSPAIERAVAGNAVADDVVDGGADRARKAAVVEGSGDGAVVDDEAVAEPVEAVRGDAGLYFRRDEVEHLGGKPAGVPHGGEAFGGVDADAPLRGVGLAQPHGRALRQIHHHSVTPADIVSGASISIPSGSIRQ